MSLHNQHWLNTPNVSWRLVVIICLVLSLFGISLYRSPAGEFLQVNLEKPIDFRLRNKLGKSPKLSSSLKIYGIDDTTMAQLGSWVLPLDRWVEIFRAIAARKPKAILVDGIFSKADGLEGEDIVQLNKVKDLGVPIVIGSFINEHEISFRDKLNLARREYQWGNSDFPPAVDAKSWHAYGPSPKFAPLVARIGHISYKSDGKVAPLLQVGPHQAIGHISLYATEDRSLVNKTLQINGKIVPIMPDGHAFVNFPSPTELQKSIRRMMSLLNKIDQGQPLDKINEGDVVFLIPQMYTGNSDFKMTPLGSMPAGLVVASMINSVLTGEWIKPILGVEILIVGASALGAVMGMYLGVVAFWSTLLGSILCTFTLTEYLFSYHAVAISWLFPLLTHILAAVFVFSEKMRVNERKAISLRNALEGAVSDQDLKGLIAKPELISLEPRERVVTIMFIDIVGFSLLAEHTPPRLAFENLKMILIELGDLVHKHGGIIDKTLGDGLLCYFGYRFDRDHVSPDHAYEALSCAIQIQEQSLAKTIEAARKREAIYPLRIGINTASCYLGDLGSKNRIDFTVVGNGVNFAKRLEGACTVHSILLGPTSYDLIKDRFKKQNVWERKTIRIKHHVDLVEAFEYDPFADRPDLREQGILAHRRITDEAKSGKWWSVPQSVQIDVIWNYGSARLISFSQTDLTVRAESLIPENSEVEFRIGGGDIDKISKELGAIGLGHIRGQIRWGYQEAGRFIIGIKLSDETDASKSRLAEVLREHILLESRYEGPERRRGNVA